MGEREPLGHALGEGAAEAELEGREPPEPVARGDQVVEPVGEALSPGERVLVGDALLLTL